VRTIVEAITGLFGNIRAEEVASVVNSDDSSAENPLLAIRNWHATHRCNPGNDTYVDLLRIMDELEVVMESGTLPDLVNAALAVVTKQLGFDDGDDEFPSQSSEPAPSRQTCGMDSVQDILKAANQIEHEAELLRSDDVRYEAEQTKFLRSGHGENTDGVLDEPDFFALISQDIRRKESSTRRKRQVQGSVSGKSPMQAMSTSRKVKSQRRNEMVANVSILVKRAREEFLIFEGVQTAEFSVPQMLPCRSQSSRQDAVRLMTVHKAKGSQWKWVFVVCADSNSFPVEGNSPFEYPATLMEEERRVFYVACTRAVEMLSISFHSSTRGTERATKAQIFQEASPFVLLHSKKSLNVSTIAICSNADVASAVDDGGSGKCCEQKLKRLKREASS
jgi:hypothetical protein